MISRMRDSKMNRRDMLRTSATGALAMAASSYNNILGANDKVNLGLIGAGGRGRSVMKTFQLNSTVNVTAVCDVYAARTDQALSTAPGARGFSDHRQVLDLKNVDAVLVATPDHWHAGIVIDAANAGKDIYVEKPLTLKIEEGPEIVKAVRVNNRVCQVGMQQRSSHHYLRAKEEYFDSGRLGKITLARTWWHGNRAHLRLAPPELQSLPSNLDWARFLGPVKWRDYDPQQYANFRAYLDFGGGQITDLFTHWIDVVHMFMGQDNPISAVAAGGVYHYKDGRTAPDTINVLLEYPNEWSATFEGTLAPGIQGAAVEIAGTEGRLYIDRRKFEFHPADANPRDGVEPEPTIVPFEGNMTEDHVNNFIDCVRSRKRANGDVWIGHRSAQASHLGNIAYLQKRRLKFDPDREEILPL